MKIVSLKGRDRHVKFTAADIRKSLQLVAAFDHAAAEHRAAAMRLAIATRNLEAFATKITPQFTRAVAANRGPVDAYGDALYTTCKKCGKLLRRSIRNRHGERLAVGYVTEQHVCKGRKL